MMDADKMALLFVQQWLFENGHSEALAALEKSSSFTYDDTKLVKSSQLMQLVWKYMEEVLATDDAAAEDAGKRAEDEAMLRGGSGDFLHSVTATLSGQHGTANVVCVRVVPNEDRVLTGAGDGHVRSITFDGDVQWASAVGSGGVLCMEMQPQPCVSASEKSGGEAAAQDSLHASSDATDTGSSPQQPPLLAVGTMDGSLSLLHSGTGRVLGSEKSHSKYLVRVAWSGDGRHVVSCSHDQTVAVHRVVVQAQDGDSPLSVSVITERKLDYPAAVQDAVVLQDGATLVVAIRDSNYLRVLNLSDMDAPEQRVNINASGDNHVSFFARHLVPSPCGRFLLVSTDTGRMMVMRTARFGAAWEHCPYPFFSLATQQFHQFAAAWHHNSFHVYAGAAGGQVWVYHVGSGKVVAKLDVHKINVRDMHMDTQRNILATCSFDKTVKLLRGQ